MNWLGWQIDYLLLLQNFRDMSGHIFDNFFLHTTMFGEMIIPIMIITLIYWCINKKSGMYIMWNYMLGFLTCIVIKMTACIYRPWILNPAIKPLPQAIGYAGGYSFPSGHSTNSVSIFGSIAVQFWKNKIVRYISIAIVLLVMFSRNYVGVHTPQDVLVSLLNGIILLILTYQLMKWEAKDRNRDLIIVIFVSIICILAMIYIMFKPYPKDFLNGTLLFDPTFSIAYCIKRLGAVFGVFYGWLLEKRFINFKIENISITKRFFRYITGLGLLILLFVYCKPLFANLFGEFSGGIVFFFTIGLFISAIYPYLIKKIKIL